MLLHVVEEMISLFDSQKMNHSPAQKRVIKIKSHEFFKTEEHVNSGLSKQDELDNIQNEIRSAMEQLNLLKTQQAKQIETTKKEIETEKNNWQQEKNEWIEKAKEEGYKIGYSAGEEQALREYRDLIDQTNSVIKRANEEYHAIVAKSDESILNLAIYVAEKILNQKIEEDSNAFFDIIKIAIKELQDQSDISIYLHPNKYSFVLDHKQELTQLLENNLKLSIYVKEELDVNACIIEHPFGQIDASIDTQLSQIKQILQDVVQENGHE